METRGKWLLEVFWLAQTSAQLFNGVINQSQTGHSRSFLFKESLTLTLLLSKHLISLICDPGIATSRS